MEALPLCVSLQVERTNIIKRLHIQSYCQTQSSIFLSKIKNNFNQNCVLVLYPFPVVLSNEILLDIEECRTLGENFFNGFNLLLHLIYS